MLYDGWDANPRMSSTARVMHLICHTYPVSRGQIVEELELSPAMVTTVTNGLLRQGLVEELGVEENIGGNSGRKRSLIGPVIKSRLGIGVELGESGASFCITDLSGEPVILRKRELGRERPERINQSTVQEISSLIKDSGVDPKSITGIGICVPGHYSTGEIHSHTEFLAAVDPSAISHALGYSVVCENDVRAMACGLHFFNQTSCPNDFALIHVGGGIFCARFVNGWLTEDSSYIAGEIGHMTVDPAGRRCSCGKYGCLQGYASEIGIIHKARCIWHSTPTSVLRSMVSSIDDITMDTVIAAYELEDPLVIQVIRDAIKYLGIAVANIAIIMGTKKIYLHSRLFNIPCIRYGVQDYVSEQLQFVKGSPPQAMEIVSFSQDRAVIGASALALDRLFIQRLT